MGICTILFPYLLFKCNSILVGFENLKFEKRFYQEHLKGLSIILFTRLTLGNNFFTSKIDSKQSPQAGHYKSKTNLTHLFHLCKLLVLCRSRKFDIK